MCTVALMWRCQLSWVMTSGHVPLFSKLSVLPHCLLSGNILQDVGGQSAGSSSAAWMHRGGRVAQLVHVTDLVSVTWIEKVLPWEELER